MHPTPTVPLLAAFIFSFNYLLYFVAFAITNRLITTGDRYRFAVVVRELRDAPTVEYKTALVAFINCIIISTPQLKDRLRIRNEFVGLKLLATLNELKTEASSDTDLAVQIDVFDEQRESDESQLQGKVSISPLHTKM